MDNHEQEKNYTSNIVFSGGGTGGSVTPLLAVAEELLLEEKPLNLFFVGSCDGPEKDMVADFKGALFKFIPIHCGKWRRYFSFHNFFDLFKIIIAFFESFKILKKTKADLVVTAGSFVSVPLVFAAFIKKIPVLVHQQDIRAGLANKLMAPFARVITISFEKSFADYGHRAVWTGNPLKDVSVYKNNKEETKKRYGLRNDMPLLVVIGGGTGALALNELVFESLSDLTPFCQVIHFTGKNKGREMKEKLVNYYSFEFLSQDEVLSILAAADLVVSRCGLGVLTELAALAKPAILIPMPDSHQEENAAVFEDNKAALVLNQKEINPVSFTKQIKELLLDEDKRLSLANNISRIMKTRAALNISALIWEIVCGRRGSNIKEYEK